MNFVAVAAGWHNEGRIGISLGAAQRLRPYLGSSGQYWTPVLWDGEEDPTWFKTAGLIDANPKKAVAKRLIRRAAQ